MKMNLRAVSLLIGVGALFFGVSACSSASSNVLATGDGGLITEGGLPGPGALAACGDNNVTNLEGTWDIVTTGRSRFEPVVTIDRNTFSYSSAERSLVFQTNGGAMTLDWTDRSKRVPILTSQIAEPLDVGIVPIPVGGDWTFSDTAREESCTASLSAAAFSGSCNRVRSTPLGTLDGTVIGQRTSKLPSVFGELGGTWRLTTVGGTIDVTISGNEFSSTAKGIRGLRDHAVTIRLCNGTLSGITNDGVELAGTRR